nr:odorant binding protein 18 [Pachyrhinus yasumatsui]
MKLFSVTLVLFLAFASVLALSRQELKDASDECNKDPATAVDSAAVKLWREQGGDKPKNSGPHTLCMTEKLKWQDASGKILLDSFKEDLKSIPAAEAEEIITKCPVEKATKEETAMNIVDCVMELRKKQKASKSE